ncbi:hypothetical protein PtrV1_02027 [Pyrenophora tritici-repentis]|nr:hypothetical protein PtrV1_02027 [Pyrenophora tritici-repentis]KAI0571416.1 hypothetical protein Alg215_10414 [Pyrenophora tritici-repentis]
MELSRFSGFTDGAAYSIGVIKGAFIRNWYKGSFWGLLGCKMIGYTPEQIHRSIDYTFVQSDHFIFRGCGI